MTISSFSSQTKPYVLVIRRACRWKITYTDDGLPLRGAIEQAIAVNQVQIGHGQVYVNSKQDHLHQLATRGMSFEIRHF